VSCCLALRLQLGRGRCPIQLIDVLFEDQLGFGLLAISFDHPQSVGRRTGFDHDVVLLCDTIFDRQIHHLVGSVHRTRLHGLVRDIFLAGFCPLLTTLNRCLQQSN